MYTYLNRRALGGAGGVAGGCGWNLSPTWSQYLLVLQLLRSTSSKQVPRLETVARFLNGATDLVAAATE